jgi:hypothetical protein
MEMKGLASIDLRFDRTIKLINKFSKLMKMRNRYLSGSKGYSDL